MSLNFLILLSYINLLTLEKAHDTCMEWARRHGVQFSPEKYQLIHFTRKRNQSADLQHTIHIQGFGGQPVQGLRVLGVWVDSKLRWSAHAAQAARKGQAQYIALSRIVNSTWGPCFQRSRLLYTAVVRPTMTYGSSIWAIGESEKGPPKSLLKPLQKVQTTCLRSERPQHCLRRKLIFPPYNYILKPLQCKGRKRNTILMSQSISRHA